jgi:hypothetical protein
MHSDPPAAETTPLLIIHSASIKGLAEKLPDPSMYLTLLLNVIFYTAFKNMFQNTEGWYKWL